MQRDGIASLARLVPTWLQNVFPWSIVALKLLAGSKALVPLKKMAPWIAQCVFTGEGNAALGRPQWKLEIVVDFICSIWEEILLECTRIFVTVAITKVMLKRMYLNRRAPGFNYFIFCTDVKYFYTWKTSTAIYWVVVKRSPEKQNLIWIWTRRSALPNGFTQQATYGSWSLFEPVVVMQVSCTLVKWLTWNKDYRKFLRNLVGFEKPVWKG